MPFVRSALIIVLFAFATRYCIAQSLTVDEVQIHLADRDTSANTVPLTFKVVWDNSWREGQSWDAAWVYAKFERQPGVWSDVRFNTGGSVATGSTTSVISPSVLKGGYANGLVVYRSENGRGPIELSVQTIWTYGASYFDLPETGAEIRAMGVELVHIPAGPFDVGDFSSDKRQPNSFRAENGQAFGIVSEEEIMVGQPGGLFYDVPDGEEYAGGDQRGPIPASFPKGTESFYIMKFPLTQGQYADFLTFLPARARASRDITAYPTYSDKGGTIYCQDGSCTAGESARAANFLSWADGVGWASWVGLRPMTEFEYEKAAEGTVVDSAAYVDGDLPDRVSDSKRISKWGAVDLRGGLWERVVSVGTEAGRMFRGTSGQGFVDDLGFPYGFANPDWPGPQAIGSGYRGGTESLLGLSEISDRTYGAYEATYGNEGQGFRGVLSIQR